MTDKTQDSVKRWQPQTEDAPDTIWMSAVKDGNWVRFDDYAALLTRAEAAEAERDALAAKLAVAVEAMREVDGQSNRTYRARNGKMCSIEADDGEACEIVHSDALFQMRAALATLTADTPKEES